MTMEVDKGTSVSVISHTTYCRLWCSGKAPALRKTDIRLRQYTGECIHLLGAIEVDVMYEGQSAKVKLIVVAGEGPSLIGRDLLKKNLPKLGGNHAYESGWRPIKVCRRF